MNRSMKSIRGVTLLEIMLVLAIAAMVIVMSVRYYQSATASQQVNSVLQQIQGITAAADGLAQGTGSYASVTDDNVRPLMPGASMGTSWGSTITITTPATATGYTVTIPGMPQNVCIPLRARLASNPKYTSISACAASGATSFAYTYNSQG